MCEIKITNVNPVDPTTEEVRVVDMATPVQKESENECNAEPIMGLNDIQYAVNTSVVTKFGFSLLSDDNFVEWKIEGGFALSGFMNWLSLVGVNKEDYSIFNVGFEAKDSVFIYYEHRSDDVHSLGDYYFYGYKPWEDDMELLEALSENLTAEELRELDRDEVEVYDIYDYEDLGKWILDEEYGEECPYALEDYVDWEDFCDNWLRHNRNFIYTGTALYRIGE